MTAERLSVVVTRRLPEAVETRMSELFDVELRGDDRPLTRDELAAAMQRADVLVPTITDQIDAGLLAQAGDRLKLIANFGAGVDHIDVATARQRGMLVSNTPGVVTEDTADMTLALILAVTRRIPEGLAIMQAGSWAGWAPTALLGGRVGGRGWAFWAWAGSGRRWRGAPRPSGCRSTITTAPAAPRDRDRAGSDLLGKPRPDGQPDGRDQRELPAHALDLPPDERAAAEADEALGGDREHLARRGDRRERADADAARSGEIAGAGLDVFERGHEVNPRLRELGNVVLLPHMGSATLEGRIEQGEKVIINIKTFADGHRPPDLVVPAML
jgi:glyoxylate reductase